MKKSKFLKSSKDMLSRSFNPSKCKTSLRLASSRLKLLRNKKEVQVKQIRREISLLLQSGQHQTARIRVEHVIREEKMMDAFDLIGIYCELIIARLPVIESQKICPIDLKEAIASIVFASPRCGDVPELADVKKHFTEKYGKEFITAAAEVRPDCGVSRMLVEKLSAVAPDGQTKIKVLSAIAEEHNIEWDAKSFGESSVPANDMLSGPSTFVKESVEPSHSQGLDTKATQSNQLHDSTFRTSSEKERLVSSQVSGFNSSSQHEMKPQGGERAQYFRGDGNNVPHDRRRWSMEFKDATAAAQAAAESAELASMAARAAAELSSRDRFTRQYSNESFHSNDHSLRDEDSTNRSFSQHSRLQNEQIDRRSLNNTGGRFEADHHSRNEHSHSSSLRSKASNDDDDYSMDHGVRVVDRDSRKNSFKEVSRGEKSMQRPSFKNRTAVVSDRSDSDTENYGFDRSPTYDEPQQGFQSPLSNQRTRQHFSTNTDSWSPKSSSSKTEKSSASVLLTRKSPSSDFTEESVVGSKLHDSLPVAYDESDEQSSESEGHIEISTDNRISRDFHIEQKQSLGLQFKDKSRPAFGSPHKAPPQYDQTQLSLSSDYESEGTDSERNQGKKFDADPQARFNLAKPSAHQPTLLARENRTELNGIGNLSPERETGLSFGKLTGGFRHKGYNYPSFEKNRSDVSRSKNESKATTESPRIRTMPESKNTKPDPHPTSDTDSSEEEEYYLQKSSNHKYKLSTLTGGKDLETKPSFAASTSIFGSENTSDLDEDLPKDSHRRTGRLRSGISRRTKVIPSNHKEEKYSKLNLRSEALDPNDGIDGKATTSTSTSYETPRRYEAKRNSSKLEKHEQHSLTKVATDHAKPNSWGSPEYSNTRGETSVRMPESKVELRSEAHDPRSRITKSYSAEPQQHFQEKAYPSSSSKVAAKATNTNSGGSSLHQHKSEKGDSGIIEEASLPQRETEMVNNTTSNKDSSNQKASHVHPKLPDYDSFLQFFQKNRP